MTPAHRQQEDIGEIEVDATFEQNESFALA